MAQLCVELRDVNKIYPNGFHALKNINLSVQKGDIYGIIGYSGAGKSTLIRLINLLEYPTKGEVIVNGKVLNKLSDEELRHSRQKIGMIFQHFNLLSARNVFGNIAFCLEIAKWEKSKIAPRVEELLDLVGLKDKRNYFPSELSGGQKQRVAIARALANHPDLLLCDEATSALDTKTTKSILNLIREIQQKLGLTVILITHQIEVVKEICNKMCVVSDGEIVERGEIGEVFMHPKAEVTRELISHSPPSAFVDLGDERDTFRIIFTGPNASAPLISQMVRKFDIDVNILSGNIEEIQRDKVGHLVVKFCGDSKIINESIAWLKSKDVLVEKFSASLNPQSSLNLAKNGGVR